VGSIILENRAHTENLEEDEFVLSQSTLLKINSNKAWEDFEDG